jgi:hypothetical protein
MSDGRIIIAGVENERTALYALSWLLYWPKLDIPYSG